MSRTTQRLWLVASSFAGALGLLVGDARAGDFPCPPSRGPVTIGGNIVVVGTCVLDRTTVDGNVIIEAQGDLAAQRANIKGNVQTDGARRVRLARTDVDGSVQLEGLNGNLSAIWQSVIGGSVQVEDNRSTIGIVGNRIDADLQANQNTGGVLILDNDIGGNLQCQSNRPRPVGGNNVVDGSKEDQCAGL